MSKTASVYLILFLSLSHYITCNELDERRKQEIAYLSESTGLCSKYFQYLRIDDYINGKLTLPNMKLDDNVKMTFYRKQFGVQPRYNGTFLPDMSSDDVINKVQIGQAIAYRVDFPPSLRVPELIQIFINGNELCNTTFDKSSDDILILQHSLNVINDSLPVFTYNIYIPNIAERPNNSCGLIDTAIASHAVTPLAYGGTFITRGEYPWLTAIYKKHTSGIIFICGGSLVTSKFILSAAHCFVSLSLTAGKIVAMLGRFNLTNYSEDGYTIREIETIILHPDYKPGLGFSDADLALLELREHVSYTKFIKPICLWSEPAEELRVVNQTGVVVGWGSDEDGNSISNAPKKVKLKIVSAEECLRSALAFNAITSSRTLCAGNRDGSGPCEGDSGGGLILNRNGVYMIRGIISVALTLRQRCNLQEYTVYCDVAKHMPWLQNYTKGQDLSVTGSLEDICGRSDTESHIEHPWLAAIYRKTPTGELFYCTGSLISSRTLLARASCLVLKSGATINPDFIRIYLGRYDLNNTEQKGIESRDVAAFVLHPDYKKSNSFIRYNNIVLLQMKDPVSFTQHVKPICLWSEPSDQSQIVGKSATLTSWDILGVYEENSTLPISSEVNIVPVEECQQWGYNVSTSSPILCIPRLGNKVEGILMLKRDGRWLLRGVSSSAYRYTYYSTEDFWVYADIAKYLTWIQSNMLS